MIEERSGWFVTNVRDARWINRPGFGIACVFERPEKFEHLGVTLFVLEPGKPNCRYHRESTQEGYLILSGRCLLLVNGEERPLQPWDYVHLPAGVSHVLVGLEGERCLALAVGARAADHELFYPHHEVAKKHAAQAPEPTPEPRVAYADVARRETIPAPEGPWGKG